MSIPKRVNISCPQCGKQFQTTIFESVNSAFSADIAETIISGTRFNASCPKCGFIAHLEYDVLYHDMKHGAMVWVIHENNINYSQRVSEVRSSPLLPYKTTRIVSDMNELREKVACLEAGKDDRVIELCKVFLSDLLMAQQPDFKVRNAFYTYSGGKNIVFFYDENGKETSCYLEDQIYDLISNMFGVPLSHMDKSPYRIIDRDWAAVFFELLLTEDADLLEEQNTVTAEGTPDSEISEWEDSDEFEVHTKEDEKTSFEQTPERQPQKRTLFCRKCGAKLLSDSLFCSYCGTKVISLGE